MMTSIPAWLLTYAVHSTILLSAAFVFDRIFRSAHGIREHAWKAAAVGAVVTSIAQVALITWQPGVTTVSGHWDLPQSVVTQAPRPVIVDAAGEHLTRDHTAAPSVHQNSNVTPAPAQAPIDWLRVLMIVWLFGTLMSALRLAVRHIRVRRYVGAREPYTDGLLAAELIALRSAAGIKHDVNLTLCSRDVSPLVLGSREICMPRSLLSRLPLDQQRSVLAHELAHIARHDPAWLRAFSMLEVLFFFQPLNWLARRRLQECAEYLCDARASRMLSTPLPLARTLVDVAQWLESKITPLPYPAMANHQSLLADRIDHLLEGRFREAPRATGALASIALLLFVFIAPTVTQAVELAQNSQEPPLRIREFQFRGEFGDGKEFAKAYNAWRDEGAAQLKDYVAHAGTATVRFQFVSRDGVCGTGVEHDGTRMFALQPTADFHPAGKRDKLALYVRDSHGLKRDELGVGGTWTTPCQKAPTRVDLSVVDGQATAVEITVGDPAPRIDGKLRDLGEIPSPVAGTFLLSNAVSRDTELAQRALLAAVMAKGGVLEDQLYELIAGTNAAGVTKVAARRWIEAMEHEVGPPVPQSPQSPQSPQVPRAERLSEDVALIKDLSKPFGERMDALDRLTAAGIKADKIISFYDDVPDRGMRVELINWLAHRPSDKVERKLQQIVNEAHVVEEQEAAYTGIAVIAVNEFVRFRFDDVVGRFNADLAKSLPAKRVGEAWLGMTKDHGGVHSIAPAGVEYDHIRGAAIPAVRVRVNMEKSPMDVRLSFDKQSRISSFWIVPPK